MKKERIRLTIEEQTKRVKFFKELITSGEVYLWGGQLFRSDTHKSAAHISHLGYRYLTRRIKGVQTNMYEHRLLYCYYNNLDFIPEGYEVNHKNYDRMDNSPENLELLTQKENMAYSKERVAESNKGSGNGNAKLTERDVIEIYDLATHKVFKQYEIAKLYGVDKRRVSAIKRKLVWKSLLERVDT